VKLTDAEKMECAASQRGRMSAAARARFESTSDAGKLLTPSVDDSMFAYVDGDPSVPPPVPNPWGCTDCFYPVLKIARAADGTVLGTIRLPEFGHRWNYATSIAWSRDGKTLLVGGEAGPSDSKFEDYWLLDWTNKRCVTRAAETPQSGHRIRLKSSGPPLAPWSRSAGFMCGSSIWSWWMFRR